MNHNYFNSVVPPGTLKLSRPSSIRSPEWGPEILTQRFAEQPTGLLLKFYKEPGVGSGESYPEVCGAAHRPPPQVLLGGARSEVRRILPRGLRSSPQASSLSSIMRSPEWGPEILTQRFAEQPTGLLLKFY